MILYNGFMPGQCQVITWTIVDLLLVGTLVPNHSEIVITIHRLFQEMHLKMQILGNFAQASVLRPQKMCG